MTRVIGLLVLMLVVLGGTQAAEAQSTSNFQKAGRALACQNAPSVGKINLNSHKFNAGGSKMYKSGGRVHGRFNHHLTLRPDDDVDFSFIEGNDSASSIKIEVNNGGFFGWVDDLIDSTIGSMFGLLDIQADEVLLPQVAEMASDLVGRPWRSQAVGLVMVARAIWETKRLNPSSTVCNP
jgi:hypothetical protein